MSRTSGLFRLQAIDRKMDGLQERLDQIQTILGDDSERERIQQELIGVRNELRAAHREASRAEHEVMAQREKLERSEQALYGGAIQNPKELQDLQAEAESLKRHIATLEDRQLEAMLAHEEVEQREQALARQLADLDQARLREHAELRAEQEDAQAKLKSLTAEREVALASILEQDLERYEALRSRLGGLAIVRLEEGACGACGLAVAASTVPVIRGGSELVACSQCGRVLYLD